MPLILSCLCEKAERGRLWTCLLGAAALKDTLCGQSDTFSGLIVLPLLMISEVTEWTALCSSSAGASDIQGWRRRVLWQLCENVQVSQQAVRCGPHNLPHPPFFLYAQLPETGTCEGCTASLGSKLGRLPPCGVLVRIRGRFALVLHSGCGQHLFELAGSHEGTCPHHVTDSE